MCFHQVPNMSPKFPIQFPICYPSSQCVFKHVANSTPLCPIGFAQCCPLGAHISWRISGNFMYLHLESRLCMYKLLVFWVCADIMVESFHALWITCNILNLKLDGGEAGHVEDKVVKPNDSSPSPPKLCIWHWQNPHVAQTAMNESCSLQSLFPVGLIR
jgi:hypothetical protein